MNTPAPIDEHALLVAIRQNNRIARLAEPLQAYWIGKRVDEEIAWFVLALRALCSPPCYVVGSVEASWSFIIDAMGSGRDVNTLQAHNKMWLP